MRKTIAILLACCAILLCGVVLPAQQAADFGGRVTDVDRHGVANLEVKLTPPRNAKQPIRLGSTDSNGVFVFRQLAGGRYLLELSQGVYLVYRAEVDTTKQSRVEVTLRSRF